MEFGLGVDPQGTVDGRGEVARRVRAAGGIGAVAVGLADRLAAADSRPGEDR